MKKFNLDNFKREALKNYKASQIKVQETPKFIGLCVIFSCDQSDAYWNSEQLAKDFDLKITSCCGLAFEMIKVK